MWGHLENSLEVIISVSNLLNTIQPQFPPSDKERFDLCITMLKAYYDALEGRLGSTISFFVVVIIVLQS